MSDNNTKINWNLSPELLRSIQEREAAHVPKLQKCVTADPCCIESDEVVTQINESFASLGRDRWYKEPTHNPLFKFPINRRLDPVFDTLMLKQPVKVSGASLTLADADSVASADDLFSATCIALTALTRPLPIGHPDSASDCVTDPTLCAAIEQCMRGEERAAANGTLTHIPFPYSVTRYTRNAAGDFVEVTS